MQALMLARFTDVDFLDGEPAIDDYIYSRLVSLEKSAKPLTNLVDGIDIHANTAKHITRTIPLEHDLTHDEAAAIYLYSMQTGLRSLYRVHTALNKLPSIRKQVWRGVSKNVSAGYTQGMCFTWKSFLSCSTDAGVVKGFLKNEGHNTLFSIACKNGKIISKYSAFKNEPEVILMPGTRFQVNIIIHSRCTVCIS